MRRGEGGLDIAVTGAQHQRLGRQTWREAAGRCAGIQYRCQLVRLDRNQLGGILGQIGIGREHHRDRLAHIAQTVPRQHRLAIGAQCLGGRVAEIDWRQARDVRRRPDRGDPRCGPRRRDIDAQQHGVRIGRAHDAHMKLMREADIADKLAPPGEQWRVLQPRERASESRPGSGFAVHAGPFDLPNSAITARIAATIP